MGLLEAVRAIRVDERGIAYVDTRGRHRARIPAEAFGGEGIVAEIEVLRGDLADLMYEATRETTEYLFDDAVTAIDQDADGVTVRFRRAPERRFGLVVGADGLHSGVRALAFGPEERFVRSLGCLTAYFTVPNRYRLDGWFEMYNAPGAMVALRPDRDPAHVKALLAMRTPATPVDRRDPDALRAMLARQFAGVGWVADQVIADMRHSTDVFHEELGQVRMDAWSSGRVVLLGDAAWCPSPVSGLGTSTALVGAYVLAGELARAGGDHVAAFAAYEERLRPYIAESQQLPPGGTSGFVPASRVMIGLRMLTARMMTRWPLRNVVAKEFTKAEAVDLPDYTLEAVA
jgi:2-polyprenyl-6-methoxyphenol hydroxylase-like FAD-dependent oxidoreductase